MTVPYDAIADWYEDTFLPGQAAGDPLEYDRRCRRSSARGRVGASRSAAAPAPTRAGSVGSAGRRSGWTCPPACSAAGGAGCRSPGPTPSGCRSPTAPSRRWPTIMVHTDMPGYPAVLREAARVLRPGGVLAHVGVHPCFCGGVRRLVRSADGRHPARLPGRPLDHRVVERPGHPGQGRAPTTGRCRSCWACSGRPGWSWSGSPRAAAGPVVLALRARKPRPARPERRPRS